MARRETWVERALTAVAPTWALRRQRARLASVLLARHYEAASPGRRTSNWYRVNTDANTAVGASLATLRNVARDLVRNNPYAESALSTIVDQAVGWGLQPATKHEAFTQWANSTECDADGRHDLFGLQKLVMRTVVESGECLVRRRWRRLEDGFALPVQLQILEPDFLDTTRDTATLPSGGQIIQGVEFDALGRRVAFWMYRQHPGAARFTGQSTRVSAEDVRHVFKQVRPGQVRGPSWFAPTLLRFKDFDEYEDATLMKQKIAACLAVLTSDVDGSAPALGTADDSEATGIDTLEPGMIMNVPPGRSITVVQPPNVQDYDAFARNQLRAIAAGLGVTYEDLTGDYGEMSFSAARMSRLRHWDRVEDWRWRLLVPQFLNPAWTWAMQAADLLGMPSEAKTEWTAPPLPMIEPDKEGLAIQRNIRTGITTLSEAIRERGYNRDVFLAELKQDFDDLDKMGLVLDCDPRKMTQAGQAQGSKLSAGAERIARLFSDAGPEVAARWARLMCEPPPDRGAS